MRSLHCFYRRSLLATVVVMSVAAATTPFARAAGASGEDDIRYLVYVPSRSTTVDHAANVSAFEVRGFTVVTLAYAGEDALAYARRVRGEVRALISRGVSPDAITVVGAGSGSPVAALVSATTGDRRIHYALLGNCDERLAAAPGFHMSGRVLGIRDAGDRASLSCRRLWQGAPKLAARRDLLVDTGHGPALFDAPRAQWLQPLSDWSRGGRVAVGDVKVAALP
jgi:hypothetical protein